MTVIAKAKRVLVGAAATGFLWGAVFTMPARAATAALPPSVAASKTLTFCAAMTLPPLTFVDAQERPAGVDTELGDALAAHLGVKAKWVNIAFSGIIPALIAGHCDAIMSALYIEPARLKVIDEIPYMDASQSVLLKAGAPKLASVEDLSGKKVATVTGSMTNELLDGTNAALVKAGRKPMTLVMFPNNSEALQELQFGQVDAFGVQYETAVYYSRKAPGQFQLGLPAYYKTPIAIGVRKGDPAFEAAIEGALAAMAKDGSYAAVLNKWGLGADALPR